MLNVRMNEWISQGGLAYLQGNETKVVDMLRPQAQLHGRESQEQSIASLLMDGISRQILISGGPGMVCFGCDCILLNLHTCSSHHRVPELLAKLCMLILAVYRPSTGCQTVCSELHHNIPCLIQTPRACIRTGANQSAQPSTGLNLYPVVLRQHWLMGFAAG